MLLLGILLICSFTEQVNGDCPVGQWGSSCEKSCPQKCVNDTCYQNNGYCKNGCVSGYWGANCVTYCPVGCLNNTCDRYDGKCTSGCGDGYFKTSSIYNPKCEACPNNCKRCRDSTVCVECFDGYFGDNCDKRCPTGCKRCVATYAGGGYAYCLECLPNLYGQQCMFNCSYCVEDMCSRDNCLKGCVEGWSEYQSRMCVKCPSTCKKCNSWSWNDQKCVSCPQGSWGPLCDNLCPALCPGQNCNQDTGRCECMKGFYLDTENNICKKCPENCLACTAPSNCTECKETKYGNTCENSCPPNCLECPIDGGTVWDESAAMYQYCHWRKCKKGYYLREYCYPCEEGCSACWWMSRSGILECTSCHEGYYRAELTGRSITKCFKCPPGCKLCTHFGDCYSCFEGYHHFEYTCCPNNCITCSSPTDCTTCREGFYGNTCNLTCPGNCQKCSNGNICDSCKPGTYSASEDPSENFCECSIAECTYRTGDGNCSACKKQGWYPWMSGCCECRKCKDSFCDLKGVCFNGCALPGTFGSKCELNCRSVTNNKCVNCTGKDKWTVKCTDCVSKFDYAADGQCIPCPPNCKDGTCNEEGVCTGCKEGWTGPKCSLECPIKCKYSCDQSGCLNCNDRYFGEECNKGCNENCLGFVCHKETGRCMLGCVDGFYGDHCELRKVEMLSDTGPDNKAPAVPRCGHGEMVLLLGHLLIFNIVMV